MARVMPYIQHVEAGSWADIVQGHADYYKYLPLVIEKFKPQQVVELGSAAGKSVEKLKNNGSVATSNLANSGRVKKMKNYWTVGYTASYAWVVEYGRKAGTYPPIQPLIDWVHKKRTAIS